VEGEEREGSWITERRLWEGMKETSGRGGRGDLRMLDGYFYKYITHKLYIYIITIYNVFIPPLYHGWGSIRYDIFIHLLHHYLTVIIIIISFFTI